MSSNQNGEASLCNLTNQSDACEFQRNRAVNGQDRARDALAMKSMWWDTSWTIPGTSWTIRGYSRSAFRTGFYIPQLDLMLDAGPQNFNKPTHVLITHTHMDHIACLPMTMIGDIHGDHIFQLYGPAEAQEHVSNYIRSMFHVNAVSFDVPAQEWFTYKPLKARDTFIIEVKKTKLDVRSANGGRGQRAALEVEVFECRHSIPTISYGISVFNDKLKDEYVGLTGPEIVTLKKSGQCVTQVVKQKKLAYVCDTNIDVFALNPTLLSYPVIFIECTFICLNARDTEAESLQRAYDTSHIHWQQLKPHVLANPDTLFVLFHFSQRYRDQEITDFFQQEMEKDKFKNIHCWVMK